MIKYIKNNVQAFMRYRPLLLHLVSRDIKVKYRRSVLGVAWSVLNPLLMMLVQWLVFERLFKFDILNYPVYLLSAQVMFNFFSESTSQGLDSVLGGAALLKKVYIPKYIFPLEKVMFSLINTAFSFIALIIVLIFTRSAITPWVLLIPLPLALLFIFNFGVSLILSSLTVFFRDIKHFYAVFVTALNYLTPIFYPESILEGWMTILVRMNPVYWYVMMSRQLILYGNPPTQAQLIATSGCAVVSLLLGLLIFKKTQDKFILHI